MKTKPISQNVIPISFDVDLTLTSEYMQGPMFRHYMHDPDEFWKETEQLRRSKNRRLMRESDFPKELQLPRRIQRAAHCDELTYARMILDHVEKGCPQTGKRWKGLSRRLLRELGKEIQLFPGLPEAFTRYRDHVKSNPEWKKHNVTLELYLISAGIADMIAGSPLGKLVDGIFACEFDSAAGDDPIEGEIRTFEYPLNDTTKTRFIYHIRKGLKTDVNEFVPESERRVPGQYMMYVGDGQFDIPSFTVINKMDGESVAVYAENDEKAFQKARDLLRDGRVKKIAPANYTEGSTLDSIITRHIDDCAEHIMMKGE